MTIDYDYIPFSLLTQYVDTETTEKINNVNKYKAYNEFIPDSEITLDELKKFRWWLADTLLAMDEGVGDYDDKTNQMLEYYQKNMYNEVIDQLTNFKSDNAKITFSTMNTCACTQNLTTEFTTSGCDPIAIYRQNIYEYMVKTFSEIDFWKDLDIDFLSDFKLYIDGIISYNLPLYTSEYVTEFADCSCVNVADTAQKLLQQILKNLSTSLGYMIDGQVDGHKNFIIDSFNSWASKLYEKMYWA